MQPSLALSAEQSAQLKDLQDQLKAAQEESKRLNAILAEATTLAKNMEQLDQNQVKHTSQDLLSTL